jgi:hypothetical protein
MVVHLCIPPSSGIPVHASERVTARCARPLGLIRAYIAVPSAMKARVFTAFSRSGVSSFQPADLRQSCAASTLGNTLSTRRFGAFPSSAMIRPPRVGYFPPKASTVLPTLGENSLKAASSRISTSVPPLQPDPSSSPPIWICPTCQKLMRIGTIEVANGEERTKLVCATCGTQATQSTMLPV